ncbi:hypothetical protein ACFRCI_03275 [Streptomyces sp. NPDC056638]|uniref:hypothetical protein n=1 Tax=Streptomyces sp. NPDC056638 TaxID=3345887 RepID=UPI00369A4981
MPKHFTRAAVLAVMVGSLAAAPATAAFADDASAAVSTVETTTGSTEDSDFAPAVDEGSEVPPIVLPGPVDRANDTHI